MKKALVIFSGGQDSTTCLVAAINLFDNVEAITFNYGQKHSVELVQAKAICEKLGVKQTVIDMSFLDTLVESALTSNGDVNKQNSIGLPSSFVPNRNQLFITLAHSFAQKIGATVLVGGMCQTDYSGYPDCREEFLNNLLRVTNVGSGIGGTKNQVELHTPLMFLTKAETFDMAAIHNGLDIVIEMSHTCYNGDRQHKHEWGYGCGTCPACELREKGWNEYQKQFKNV